MDASPKPIKAAIVTKLLPDATLVALWGAAKIVSGWLPAGATFPVTTMTVASHTEDAEAPEFEDIVQLAHWAKTADVCDAIASRCRELLHRKPLAATGRRVDLIREEVCLPRFEQEAGVHSVVQQFRIISRPTA